MSITDINSHFFSPMVTVNNAKGTITIQLNVPDAYDMKGELLNIKSIEDLIPFIDKCPKLWELLGGLHTTLSNIKTTNQ